MPEPVSCHASAPGSSVIECDAVVIGPEPDPEPEPSHAESAGARALVERHTPPLVLRDSGVLSVPIETPYDELARDCSAKAIAGGLVIAGATSANVGLGLVTAVRAGLEIAQCFDETTQNAQRRDNERRGLEHCESIGGTPLGVVGGAVICERQVPESVR